MQKGIKTYLPTSFILAALLCTVFSGCGSGTGIRQVSGTPALRRVDSVTNFGDSITCGYFATPNDGTGNFYSTHGYASQFDQTVGAPAQNACRPGDQAADLSRLWVLQNAAPRLGDYQLYTVLIGTNDANACGGSPSCLENFSLSLTASLAWLGLPATDKTLASAMSSRTGIWAVDDAFAAGLKTTSSGSTLTTNITQAVAGRSLYIAYRVEDPQVLQGGIAVVSVDGVDQTTLLANPGTGHDFTTQHGVEDTVFAATVALGAVGNHAVSVRVTSANGAAFSLLWMGASTGNYNSVAGAPRVLIGTVTRSTDAGLNAIITSYNNSVASIVADLAAQGVQVRIAPTWEALNVSEDLTDFVHPNNSGHAKLAAAFLSVL